MIRLPTAKLTIMKTSIRGQVYYHQTMSFQEYPPLLTPDTSTSYRLQLDNSGDETSSGSLPADCKVQCQKVVNDAVLSVPHIVLQVPVSEACNKDTSNLSSIF
ncbi:hypothetical protein J6590_085928 [Homalodisca vitripennis]|nr:hypothetical protein J6590_085928 [Homalodisca vitripennis]